MYWEQRWLKPLSQGWLFGMLLGTAAFSQEVAMPVRSSTADGRISVMTLEAASLPKLSVWSGRSLERLEKQWKRRIPFQVDQPLELRMQNSSRDIRLNQSFEDGRFVQVITLPRSPEEVYAMPLAKEFVAAMTSRLLQSGDVPPRLESGSPSIPWSTGAAVPLVEGAARRIALQAVEDYGDRSPPTPEVVSVGQEMSSYLLYRWMLDTHLGDRQTAAHFWKRFQSNPEFTPQDWVAVTPGVSSLRDLHMQWDVWWKAERRMLISEFRLYDATREWLVQELNPVPRFLGLDSSTIDAGLTTAFPDFEAYLDHPSIEPALMKWMLRLQAVRFRQPGEMNQLIKDFEDSLHLALEAVRFRGRHRALRWAEAVRMWNEALSRV